MCVIFFCPYLHTDVREIKMIIKTGHGMEEGSKDDIVFELQQPETNWEICKTSTFDDFSPSETLIWKDESLGDCKDFMFNTATLSINFWIKTSDDKTISCPESVEVVMNDEEETSFFTDDMKCENGKNKNWFKHNAKIRSLN